MTDLFNNVNYKSPRDCVISEYIREYDISKANVNILMENKMITEDQYKYFMNCSRMERQVKIGLMISKNSNIGEIIKDGIIQAKRSFFLENNIDDSDVLEIRNDAVFLLNKTPRVSKFGLIEFKNKNTYTSFYRTKDLEFFYYQDQINNREILNIKGIGDDSYISRVYPLHKDYFLEFLLTVFDTAQNCSITDVINIITLFYNKYINRELGIPYYREFNSQSMYRLINITKSNRFPYFVDNISIDQLKYVDIETNREIISNLFNIFTNLNKVKRY